MELYSVHFTTKHVVTRFDNKGNVLSEYTDNIPQTIHGLPLATAKQYETCDNFKRFPYTAEVSRNNNRPYGDRRAMPYPKTSKAMRAAHPIASKADKIKKAALTGDLGAALATVND